MPVFRLSDIGHPATFFSTLYSYLQHIAREGKMSMHTLSRSGEDRPNTALYPAEPEFWDTLLVRDGKALAAVTISFRSSYDLGAPVEGYIDAPAYQGTAGVEGNLSDLQNGLTARLRDELDPAKPVDPPKDTFREATWVIRLRTPDGTGEPQKWLGSPFDVDQIETAFNAIVDTLVARAKPAPTAVASMP